MTKKRLMNKVVALAAMATMLLSMAMPAMAAPTLADTGTITVHKYAGHRGGVIENTTGEELGAGDTNHPLNNGFTALPGAEFTLYKVDDLDGVMDKLRDGETITATEVVAGDPPSVKYTFSDGDVLTESTTAVADDITDTDGKIVFGNDDLEDGVYVLVETDTPTGYRTAAPSIIRLPLTNSTGDYNYNVHVYPKNIDDTNIAKKDVEGVLKPVSKNDVINFELKAKFLSDTVSSVDDLRNDEVSPAEYGVARITETFSAYFQADTGIGAAAFWLKADGTIDPLAPIAASDITIGALPAAAGGSFSATLTDAGIDTAIAGGKIGFGITVSAKYLGDASADTGADPDRLTNKMTSYIEGAKDGPGGGEEEEDETYVPSISIKVNKEQSDGSPLEDVVFALATVAVPRVNLVPGQALSAYEPGEITLIEAEYVLGADGEPLMATTDSDGNVLFSNLNGYDNDTGATFYLKELKTVDGYKLRVPAIEVNFKNKAGYASRTEWFDGAGNWAEGANVVETATIVNYKLEEPGGGEEPGFNLPLTGGAGTIAFTVAGILVMLGAAVLIVKKKKEA